MDDLPGVPFHVKLKCPSCGWNFDLGLRLLGQIEDGSPDGARGFTVCSKCVTALDFKIDGTDVRALTPEVIARMPMASILVIQEMLMLTWASNQLETASRPLQ